MLSTKEHVESKSRKSGQGRFEYLQTLVTEFQDTDKSGILANCNYKSILESFLFVIKIQYFKRYQFWSSLSFKIGGITQAYSEHCQTSNMERFALIVNG